MHFSGRKLFLIVLWGIALFCTAFYWRMQVVRADTLPLQLPVIQGLEYYKTSDTGITVQDVVALHRQGSFTPVTAAVFNPGIAAGCYWFHFTISGYRPDKDQLLEIDNSRINQMELFVVTGAVRSLGRLGDVFPFDQRQIKNKNFVYRLPEEADSKTAYLLFVNEVGNTLTLPIRAVDEDAFYAGNDRYLFLGGWVYGILMFVALMSFLFFWTSGHKLYLFYSLYIISGVLWLFSYFGIGYAYIWGQFPRANITMAPFAASLNILLNLQVCQLLLKLPATLPGLNRYFNICKGLLMATAAFPVGFNLNHYGYMVNHSYLVVFLSVILLSMLLLSYTVIRDMKSATAKVYLFASLVKAGGIIHLVFVELGAFQAVLNLEGLLQAGILLEILLLTYALASRYAVYRLKIFSKVIEAHEKERSRISKEIHDSISNNLTSIYIGIGNIAKEIQPAAPDEGKRLQKLRVELAQLQTEVRSISHNVMPDFVHTLSLNEIVETYIEKLKIKLHNAADPLKVEFSSNTEVFEFGVEARLNIFRIVQEIVTNILKHSNARQADIVFDFHRNKLLITAEDDGIGLVNMSGKKGGLGLDNIRSRVELLQGRMHISAHLLPLQPAQSTEAYGTKIDIEIPYRSEIIGKNDPYEY